MLRIDFGILAVVASIAMYPTQAHGQIDQSAVRAIVEQLSSMQSDYPNVHGLWIRRGVFELSRHDVKHSFRTPVREWSASEQSEAGSTAARLGQSLRFCQEDCRERPRSGWTVTFGVPTTRSADELIVPVQVEGSEETSSFKVVYEMVLDRSPDGLWQVKEALPGASSDAVSCIELYGHSCDEEFGPKEQR